MRYFIIDDSGSMLLEDGHKQVGPLSDPRMVSCSRWDELGDRIRFYAGLAEAAEQATEFRLLNRSVARVLGRKSDKGASHKALLKDLALDPRGETPLCR